MFIDIAEIGLKFLLADPGREVTQVVMIYVIFGIEFQGFEQQIFVFNIDLFLNQIHDILTTTD